MRKYMKEPKITKLKGESVNSEVLENKAFFALG